ncbi:Kelch-like protein 30 [Colletotrichum spaethianum]|uniref:Kelch-like protein 30 n=1 Tax=Colletotrichum spaethianum TaxID=700344 RepID=A0AA37PEL9_9PEZI|nr:Kelch-like protein 30 [Colletotrichum spaethianum]GKT50788.1 Kelch-like protein 30 [Colletotrichum spaethianum]
MAEEDHRWLLYGCELSDFTIICEGEEIQTHKLILAMHSGYFKRLFENDSQEKSEALVGFDDVDTKLMTHLLDYFYRGTTDWYISGFSLDYCIRLWLLADRFEARTVNITIEKHMMTESELYEEKSRIATTEMLDMVFTHPNCADSALGYITGEAAWICFLSSDFSEAATAVKDASSRYNKLANVMLFWSAQYIQLNDSSNGASSCPYSHDHVELREDVIAQKFW